MEEGSQPDKQASHGGGQEEDTVWPPALDCPDDAPSVPKPPSLVKPLAWAVFASISAVGWFGDSSSLPSVSDGPLAAFSHYATLTIRFFIGPLVVLAAWASFIWRWQERKNTLN
jgi:hypothetical protein